MKKQNSKTTPLCHRACALLLAASLTLSPALTAAATPTIPGFYGNVPMPAAPVAGTLPLLLANGTKLGITGATRSGNTLTIDQNAPQAIIDWASFNIAPDSVVIFKQQLNGVNQTSWAALNRIFSASPSLIFGSIQAPGKIYLINQNGILFGKDSRVDTHSLVASALNITNDDFINGRLRFTTAPFGNQGALSSDSTVSNYGSITTDNGGSVFLVGPRVENAGSISSPGGKIDLVGVGKRADGSVPVNGEVEIFEQTANDTDVDVTYSDRQVPGAAFNLAGGSLVVDTGRIGMYGTTVQNDGLIRAVTALKKGGVVYLAARDSISTGAQSVIETPVPASSDTAHPSFTYAPGNVTLTGITTTTGLTPVDTIEHLGAISAPSGNVTLNATKGVLLGEGSSISVAGLWLDRSVTDNLMEAQLNSVELRDEYAQKGGVLQGKTIKVDVLSGSNIGNLDGHYLGIDSGAQQRSTGGGTINISSSSDPLARLTVMDGALLDFSGGGVRYGAGMLATSKLASGGKVYDISTAPKNITYDALLDSQKRTNTRFGVVQNYSGLYFGGATSVGDYSAGRTVGAAAGKADLEARVIVLDGTLKAAATAGLYQTKVTPSGSNGEVSVARGMERPTGGTLQLGRALLEAPAVSGGANLGEDAVLTEASIAATTTKYAAGDPLPTSTRISASTLSNAGLGSLSIFANSAVTFGEGSRLTLQPGASLTARGGRIEQQGEIVIPGGSVILGIRDTIAAWEFLPGDLAAKNPLYQPVVSSINLAAGSVISVAGQKVDNSAAGGGAVKAASTDGGSIMLVDASFQSSAAWAGQPTDAFAKPSEGHIINLAYGALLDVSGGYLIDGAGKIAGGNAGSLTMKAPTLSLGGELKGLSLAGKTGGAIMLHAGEVVVTKHDVAMPDNLPLDSPIPDYLNGKLVISDTRLQDTGFTRISLIAINDLTVTDGALLAPSTRKMETPVAQIVSQRGGLANSVVPAGYDTSVVDYLGSNSISLAAGQNIYTYDIPLLHATGAAGSTSSLPNPSARVTIAAGSGVNPTPGGDITVKAPVVELSGTLEALGGSITVTASGSSSGDLTVHDGGRILAGGYNKPDSSLVAGLPAGPVPKAGGTVKLSSDHDIVLESGALIDVSGSVPVQRLAAGADGVPVSQAVAGNPGSLTLSTGNRLVLDGEISGRSTLAGQPGGSLTLASKLDQSLRQADLDRYLASGFDALSFVSTNTGVAGSGSIRIQENLDLHDARSLTLDAMSIAGNGAAQATLQAKWIRLVNSNLALNPTVSTKDTGTGALSLKAGFLDVEGNLLLTGFNQVTLQADHDLRFADRTYTTNNTWSGNLQSTGDLTLKASRIYPTSATAFAVSTPGKATILPGVIDTNPVYSAGGSLTITAAGGIEQRGTLLAPQGSITLDAGTGQLLLAAESRIVTGGSVPVAYGTYDGSTWMTHAVASNGNVIPGVEVTKPPTGSVSLNGHEVLVSQGATIDVSGGGSVYASLFQPSIAGSSNPLAASTGRCVILPDRSVTMPGAAVYLDAVPSLGLAAGVYSLLPADLYANAPGALVVQATGQQVAAGQRGVTSQGYQVTAGYATVTDTQIASQARQGYSVRSAADVVKEGDFSAAKSFVTGNGGDVTLTANSAVFSGSLNAQPLAGYQGGTLSLSAKNVVAQHGAAELPAGFSFGDQLPTSQTDTLVLDAAAVSGKGFANLVLGNKTLDNTQTTVTVKNGSTLQASSVTLRANTSVTIETGADVEAITDSSAASGGATNQGVMSVEVPNGTFDLQLGSVVHASNALSFDAGSMGLLGDFRSDLGKLSLASNNLIFAKGAKPSGVNGLYLDNSLVRTLSEGFKDLKLTGRGSVDFQENVALTTKGSLTLDTGSYTSADGLTVAFSTDGKLTLQNSGASGTPKGSANSSSISFTGAGIDVSPTGHDIVLDQFKSVTLDSSQDVTLRGVGTFRVAQDLTVKAPRVTTSSYQHTADPSNPSDATVPYSAADFSLDAARGKVSIEGKAGKTSGDRTPGGSLTILGQTIGLGDPGTVVNNVRVVQPTVLDVPSGRLQLTATGDIALGDKTSVLATGTSQTAQSGTVYCPGGSVALTSNSGAVTLASGSLIDVSASSKGDAGSVTLSAANGGVTAASGTLKGNRTDSSAVGGSLSIDSATLDLNGFATTLDSNGTPKEDGTLKVGGFDNRVSLRSRSGDLALSSDKIISGREVVVAADGGSLTISGAVSANGNKDKAGEAGGTVALYADKALTLENGSKVTAMGGLGADGGSVSLSTLATDKIAGAYALTVASGAKIDVSGDAQGKGGNLSLRAYQIGANHDDVNLADLPAGSIVGATRVSVEAARLYSTTGNLVLTDQDTLPSNGNTFINFNSTQKDATTFMDSYGAGIRSRLFAGAPAGADYRLQPGIEIDSIAPNNPPAKVTLTLATDWNLSSGGLAGVLTLRSQGDLTLNKSIFDAPTALADLYSSNMPSSWAINLVAGADSGANYKAVKTDIGNLTVADRAVVYTQNAPIYFAAGNDATFSGSSASAGPGYMINTFMKYNLGSYGGSVTGVVGGDLNLIKSGSVIQTALGDIDLKVGRDLNLATVTSAGAIRTTGEYDNSLTQVELSPNSEFGNREDGTKLYQAADLKSYWLYHNGGNIRLDVEHAVIGATTSASSSYGWDAAYLGDKIPHPKTFVYEKVPKYLGPSFGDRTYSIKDETDPVIDNSTIGIATLGGGNIAVHTGGAFLSPIGAFGTLGEGNVRIVSGGDVTGRFRIMKGALSILGGGSFGTKEALQSVEMGAASVSLAVQGDVQLGAVFDPNNVKNGLFPTSGITSQYMWNLTSLQNSSVSLVSLAGDLTLYGSTGALPSNYIDSTLSARVKILPPTVVLEAAGNLNLLSNFDLAPSASGNLKLFAGGDITSLVTVISGQKNNSGSFIMADVSPDSIYGWQQTNGATNPDTAIADPQKHYQTVHLGDTAASKPVTVSAGRNITDLYLVLNKAADISAGKSIERLDLVAQNTAAGQLTRVSAGTSIDLGVASVAETANAKEELSKYFPGIVVGGPGDLVVSAGQRIDLGNSRGIQAVGNDNNAALSGDANVTVVVGARKDLSASAAAAFFYGEDNRTDHADQALNGLQLAGDQYAALKAAGQDQEAKDRIDRARSQIIRPYFDTYDKDTQLASGLGSLNMTRSEIKSVTGNIRVLTQGDLNLGVTALSSKTTETTGITTRAGGQIAVYSGGSINVNESRVMTFLGGDITLYSDQGDINAGRGSKTTVSPPTRDVIVDPITHKVTFGPWRAPSVGSGVRALTYDPDGPTGPLEAPPAGNVHIFAPKGAIDAGEAGIVGGAVTLGATQVLNAQNISFGAGSVGVPSGDSSVNLGSLAGNSNLSDSAKLVEQSQTLGAVREKTAQQAAKVDDFLSRWLDLRIISFDDPEEGAVAPDQGQEKQDKNKKR